MNRPADPSKRAFLQAAVALGGGLLIGLRLPADESYATHNGEGTPFAPNAWIRIGSDGLVTIIVDRSEMGQGVMTALPMLVAEELEVEWSAIRIEQAPAAAIYGNPLMRGLEATGGSTSVRAAWIPLRINSFTESHLYLTNSSHSKL